MESAPARRWSGKLLLRRISRVLRACCFASGVFFLLLCVLAFTRIPFDMHRWLGVAGGLCDSRPDRIIVLGGSGMPSGPELLRLEIAARSAQAYPMAAVLVVHPLDTATVRRMVAELVLRGVARERIATSIMGTNTREQVLGIAAGFPEVKVERIAIVTAPENMYRSLRVFRKLGFAHVSGIPAFDNPEFIDLRYSHGAIGGKAWAPDVSDDLALRYNFWNYLKLEVTCIREYVALGYYWLNDWV